MGNKTKCTPIGIGTVSFQGESRPKINITNVLHVLGIGMNLISISSLQDKGYDVFFINHKVYFQHRDWKKARLLAVRSGKLYKL